MMRAKQAVFGGVFLILLLVISIVILEVALRTTGRYYTYSERKFGEYLSYYQAQPSEIKGYPHLNLKSSGTSKVSSSEFEYSEIINDQGLRDVNHNLFGGDSSKRVLIFGDSFVEGVGVDLEQSIVGNLRNVDFGGKKYEFFNCGVSGSDPFLNGKHLVQKMLDYSPDYVVFSISSADIDDIVIRGGEERFIEGGIAHNNPPSIEYYYAKSHLIRFLVTDIMRYSWALISAKELKMKQYEAIQKLDNLIKSINALSVKEEFKFVVVFYPLYGEVLSGSYYNSLEDLIFKTRNSNIETIDLLDNFVTEVDETNIWQYYYEIDLHYTSRGYKHYVDGFISQVSFTK